MNLLEITDSMIVQKTSMTRKLTLGGVTKAYPVYRVRLDCLYYNDRNDRIATWLTQYHQNPENTPFAQLDKESFNRIIERFIIESNPTAIEKTKNNIALVNQREPGVVLCDGRIIDGNRRYTCLRLIRQADPDVNYFETVILDQQSGNDQKQIKMLELSIQHGEEQRVEYNLIDLTIGAYHDIVETKLLTIQEYAESTNETIAEVKKRLEIAELIIEFLEYMGMDGQYHTARELQIYSLLYEALPVLKRCETIAEKEDLKTSIFNNILMNSIADQKKFIRNIKKMMDEGVYAPFIRRQNKIHARIEEAREQTEIHTVKDMERFAKQHADIGEDLTVSMERSVANMKKVQSRGKPSQAISKSLTALMDIDTDVIDILSDHEREKLSKQLSKLNQAVTDLNAACAEDTLFEEELSSVSEPAAASRKMPRLAVSDAAKPIVFCQNAEKMITGLIFGLEFGAFRYADHQSVQITVCMYFIDADGNLLSNEIEAVITVGSVVKVPVTLYDKASVLKECRLVIREAGQASDEALLMLPMTIKMDFGMEFGF